MNKEPLIGITLDSEEQGEYSHFPYYVLRKNYSDAVRNAGGIPILLPHEPTLAETYAKLIDGLIITGGNFDIDPAYYGIDFRHSTVVTKNKRTEFEMAVTKIALERKIPILGICGGEQLLNVIMGGSLIQHIPDAIPNALEHEQPHPKNLPWHKVKITEGSLLHKITGEMEIDVNSTHHQAIEKPAVKMQVSGVAPDGVIEAIELEDYPFCLGVEWHPEYQMSEADKKIFKAFIEASKA
jgi:putative glutamine amidotransferase